MKTEINNTIKAADIDAQYDEKAKQLLSHKLILAYILVHTVDEFKNMNPQDVIPYIEGEPQIGVVPIDSGMTNTESDEQGGQIVGFNTENTGINEGLIRFDIVFYVRMKDGLSQIIINIEVQKDEPSEYDILNRAVFYVSRLISSQKGRDFVKTKYNDIKRVFSIWICMNTNENSMNYIHLENEAVLGSYRWKGRLDLINIIMIGLSNELPEHDEKYELHRLLGTLFSKKLTPDEKIDIIETEYSIPKENFVGKDVGTMCNLSQGIREDATRETSEMFIMGMYDKGIDIELIADIARQSIEEVQSIIENSKLVAV